jgi:hypothetical protein
MMYSTVLRSVSLSFSLMYMAPKAIRALMAGTPLLGEKFFA